MDDYTIYCTEEQTRKALKLGAPIESEYIELICKSFLIYPSTEQMLNWLEEQEHIDEVLIMKTCEAYNVYKWTYLISNEEHETIETCGFFDTRKEATIAAIDGALEYLMTKKGE